MPVKKAGWWINITNKTECTEIVFVMGTRKKDREYWFTWHQGEEREVDLPPKYIDTPNLYIFGVACPNDRNAVFEMKWQNRTVKEFNFDDHEDHEESH